MCFDLNQRFFFSFRVVVSYFCIIESFVWTAEPIRTGIISGVEKEEQWKGVTNRENCKRIELIVLQHAVFTLQTQPKKEKRNRYISLKNRNVKWRKNVKERFYSKFFINFDKGLTAMKCYRTGVVRTWLWNLAKIAEAKLWPHSNQMIL